MRIEQLKVNRICNPLGYNFDSVSLSYVVSSELSTKQSEARVEVSLEPEFGSLLFDSGFRHDINSTAFPLTLELSPRCRYFWRVSVKGDQGDYAVSPVAWFETTKMDEPWQASWITHATESLNSVIFKRSFNQHAVENNPIVQARAYVCGLGCYELYLNGHKVGNEYLAPGFHAYDKWLQYQTYDLSHLVLSEENVIEVIVGNGWYKGRLGFNHGGKTDHYGDKLNLIAEVVLTYANGEEEIIRTDDSWLISPGYVQENGIYDGECVDKTQHLNFTNASLNQTLSVESLSPRYSLPVVIHDSIEPVEVITLKNKDVILDFGQNISGWVEFDFNGQPGSTLQLQYAEVMQDGDIYIENLRSAKAQFQYIANGTLEHVRPHFTFYGFRYVKVSGLEKSVNNYHFVACHLYSDIHQSSWITTSNSKVNKFTQNVIRSQKDNFVDIPTDCPQRDERMGWTGDIQVFSSAASMNMDVYAFLSKYLIDLAKEQNEMGGAVPFIVPMFDVKEAGSCAWGDAATVLPWNMWLHYGDSTVLKKQYPSMKAWVNYIMSCVTRQNSDVYLWDSGFHFGDWLALDNEPWIKSFKGKTEDKFVASIYFYYSALIMSKTATVLGYAEDAVLYQTTADKVMNALRNEYLTPSGKLALETQTAFILAIMFDVYPEHFLERARHDFATKLARDQYQIRSGFVGTPYFCRALTKVGLNDIAYRMFLSERSPSWLFPITVGATTVWERWDSMDENGRMNPDSSMNSLNHYAFGSVIDWLYKDVCGFNPDESMTGFKRAVIKPHPNYRLRNVELITDTAAGQYYLHSDILENNTLKLTITVPFDCEAECWLPDITDVIHLEHDVPNIQTRVLNNSLVIELEPGCYHFTYRPDVEYVPHYSVDMPIRDLIDNKDTQGILNKYIPDIMALPFLEMINGESLSQIAEKPFFTYKKETLDVIEKEVSAYIVC